VKVSDTGVLATARLLQLLEAAATWVEERRAGPQQEVDEVETHLIEEPAGKESATDRGAS
jgi:hypothetical protein